MTAMAVFDDGNGPALYVSGSFTTIGGASIQRFAKWNGSAWSAPSGGTFNVEPQVLYVSSAPTGQPRLYAAGTFTTVGGNPAKGVAVYDGTAWSAIPDCSFVGPIWPRLAEFDDPATAGVDLFIAGTRELPGPIQQVGVYRYDGTTLTNIAPAGISGQGIQDMQAFDDGSGESLFAGGFFTAIDGVPIKRIAKWNGSTWSEVGGGVTNDTEHFVRDLCVWDDGNGPALYVAGKFSAAGTVPASNIARWDGTNWAPLVSGSMIFAAGGGEIRALTAFDPGTGEGLAILGDFTIPAQHMAFWNGTSLVGLGPLHGAGVPGQVPTPILDFCLYDSPVDGPLMVAAGQFMNVGTLVLPRLAAWNGNNWLALGPGFNQQVTSVVVFDDGDGAQLYASGSFNLLYGTQTVMDRFARWNGSQWQSIGMPPGYFVDMVVFDDGIGPAIYGATANTSTVHKWDGTQWTQVGAPFGRNLYSLEVFDDGNGPALYLGAISSATGAAANDSLMKWDGSTWTAVGGGVQFNQPFVNAYVYDMLPFTHNGNPVLVVAGEFTGAGAVTANGVVFWDGTQWIAPPGPQPSSNANVKALAVHDDGTGPALYAASINAASTTFNDRVVKLTPTGWGPLGFGVGGGDATVYALCSFDNEGGSSLYAGGNFTGYFIAATQTGADFRRSYGIARWFTCLEAPSIISPPDNQSAPPAANVFFDVTADGGDLTYRWRRDGVPLDNNAQQTGVDTRLLTLFNVNGNDEGDYDVVVTNVAGEVTSDSATLTITKPCLGNIIGGGGGGGSVDVNDLLAVITTWGPCPAPCPPQCTADISPNPGGDCNVDVNDLLMVITHWGACP